MGFSFSFPLLSPFPFSLPTLKGVKMAKNKFLHPPYLPEHNLILLGNLRDILEILANTCCNFQTPKGAMGDIDLLLKRPSSVRKCDLYKLKEVVEATRQLKERELIDETIRFTVSAQGQ